MCMGLTLKRALHNSADSQKHGPETHPSSKASHNTSNLQVNQKQIKMATALHKSLGNDFAEDTIY